MANECRKCGCSFPNWYKINDKRVNLGSRAYCLKCSPYKTGRGQGNRIRLENYSSLDGIERKRCIDCTLHVELGQFYSYKDARGKTQFAGRCKACMSAHHGIVKEQAVIYKGSRCQDCHGQFHYSAFDFHHLDPSKKEMNVLANSPTSLESVKQELDKCVLLCSNCHRARHYDSNNPNYLPIH